MRDDASTLMQRCEAEKIDVYRYGADLADMAEAELQLNIWAVRFLYWHIVNRGLCVRPPWSMVEHFGWDAHGTNAKQAGVWAAPPLDSSPPIPANWPDPYEHPECCILWRKVCGGRPTVPGRLCRFTRGLASKALRAAFLR